MLPLEQFQIPGEHAFTFQGQVGTLEARALVPESANRNLIALLGHPHSLHGGTMHNKVVTTLTRAFSDLGIISIRFNFRGVGASQGQYDAGSGESDDLCILMEKCHALFPNCRFILAGFSFGSYVTYCAAAKCPPALLISIAPPVNHFPFGALPPSIPWHILQGDEDEVVPLEEVIAFAQQMVPQIPVTRFAETSHFFHGKLMDLRAALLTIISAGIV